MERRAALHRHHERSAQTDFEHKTHAVPGFTARYNVDRLVYFEVFDDPLTAIAREKQLKKWRRIWKVELIERENSEWRDLAEEFVP